MWSTDHSLRNVDLTYLQLEKVHIENYKLGAHYCRQLHEKGGVAIFVHNSRGFPYVDIAEHCKEQDIEIGALKLSYGALNICVLTLYTAPSGNFSSFLTLSDPTSDLIQHYDFPVPLRCRKTSDTFLLRLCARSTVGACPTLFLM